MVDNTWLEQYREELHSLRDAGNVKAIRKKNMELNNRLEYVKDDAEREIFLTALYETEDVLRECRTEEKLRNGLTEYRVEETEEQAGEPSETSSGGESENETDLQRATRQEKERLPLRERFELECKRAEEGDADAFFCLAEFYEGQGDGNKEQRNELLKKAADAGSKEGMLRLARVYRDGDGWEKNTKKAHEYYGKLEGAGDKEAAKEKCLLFFEEERYDRVYPYVKDMIERGENFEPDNNWEDACLLVVYTVKGIHYGELQSNLENLTEMRRMIYRVGAERKVNRTDRDRNVLYTMECLYMKEVFRTGRYLGACHSSLGGDRYLYMYAILQTALEVGGTVQKEVWKELWNICKDEKENAYMRDELLKMIIRRLFVTEYYEHALYFADPAIWLFKESQRIKYYKEEYFKIVKRVKEDEKESFRCFEAVVKQGGIHTAYELATCYYFGRGCERNYEKAKLYYERGSKGYHSMECEKGIRRCEAQLELKHALEVLKTDNFAQATDAIEKLAKEGRIANAHYEYGRILEQGRYRKQDEYEAFAYYGYAAAAGHEQAKQRFIELKRSHKSFWNSFEKNYYSNYDKVGEDGWRRLENL